MNSTPYKVSILRHHPYGNSFTVIALSPVGDIESMEDLAYDEMLGCVARILCPTKDDGTVNRSMMRPLFLSPPSKGESSEAM